MRHNSIIAYYEDVLKPLKVSWVVDLMSWGLACKVKTESMIIKTKTEPLRSWIQI